MYGRKDSCVVAGPHDAALFGIEQGFLHAEGSVPRSVAWKKSSKGLQEVPDMDAAVKAQEPNGTSKPPWGF